MKNGENSYPVPPNFLAQANLSPGRWRLKCYHKLP